MTFLASVDGAVVPRDEAVIPATDEGLLRGDGVFEVVRLYAGRPYAWGDHLARLERSAQNLRLPLDVAQVRAEAEALLERHGDADGLLRIVCTRGGRRLAFTEPLPEAPPQIALATVTYAPPRILDGVKSLSYAGNMLATRLGKERGADEALLVTPHGRVLEGPTSSFFWVEGGRILTPPLGDHILDSITRARIVALTGAREEPCPLDRLDHAEECFLASTIREVQPVVRIDDRAYDPGPVTADARERFRAAVADELGA